MLGALSIKGWGEDPTTGSLSREGVVISLSFNSYRASLEMIIVPREMRGGGMGRRALEDLISAADLCGTALTLMVVRGCDGGPDASGLVRFYESLGFSLGGKGRDGGLMMSRLPEPSSNGHSSGLDEGP